MSPYANNTESFLYDRTTLPSIAARTLRMRFGAIASRAPRHQLRQILRSSNSISSTTNSRKRWP